MPELSRFFGMIIRMYYSDHAPPHFHVLYSGQEALIDIENFTIINGNLPKRAYLLVREWAEMHKNELKLAWQAAEQMQPIPAIEPLE